MFISSQGIALLKGGDVMPNPVLEAIVDIAQRERKSAVREGDYGWAIVSAIVESWATSASRAEP